MKRNIAFILIAISALSFFSCKKNDTPSAVAEKFRNHLNRLEYDEAKKYATQATITHIGIFSQLIGNQKLTNEPKKEKAKSEKINGNNAYCTFENAGYIDTLKLVKINNEWKVSFAGGIFSSASEKNSSTNKKDSL